ncbi:MAG: hypothetical protein GOVbin630_69 [Prokaryotic dsDNA virus sp.]|nr:MAG: hypothetical protein GOVbin630_69 [Prokaryotic dsDNA virus sp.]|tara:strand:- start:8694 stop:9917 length:1224 start_codon:yes stop_codon:yes gene_type:complete
MSFDWGAGTTYYVAKWGNDSNAGTSPVTPKLTIDGALTDATTDGDNVEIIDEGTYVESVTVRANDITVAHTASTLGRPVMQGAGALAWAFNTIGGPYNNLTIDGLEVKNYVTDPGNDDGGFVKNAAGMTGLTIKNCFAHQISRINYNQLGGTLTNPTLIEKTIVFADDLATDDVIESQVSAYIKVVNCLITGTTGGYDHNQALYNANGSVHSTASFSTFIHRGTKTESQVIVEKVAKVIDCIVSGAGYGIQTNDHTYNVVDTSQTNFLTAGGASASAGTGDQNDTNPLFVDGDSMGNTIAVAENYKIQADSPAYAAGIAFDSINEDLASETRVNPPSIGAYEYIRAWSDYYDSGKRFTGAFVDRKFERVKGDYKYKWTVPNRQGPFSLNIPGVPSLRNRSSAYSGSI